MNSDHPDMGYRFWCCDTVAQQIIDKDRAEANALRGRLEAAEKHNQILVAEKRDWCQLAEKHVQIVSDARNYGLARMVIQLCDMIDREHGNDRTLTWLQRKQAEAIVRRHEQAVAAEQESRTVRYEPVDFRVVNGTLVKFNGTWSIDTSSVRAGSGHCF
jgi:hypothetical protein